METSLISMLLQKGFKQVVTSYDYHEQYQESEASAIYYSSYASWYWPPRY